MKRPSFLSLHILVASFVFLVLISLLGLILYTDSKHRQLTAARAQAKVLRLTWLVSSDQERWIEEAHQLLIALANMPHVRGGDPVLCNTLFTDLLKQYPHYANLGVVMQNGDLFCSAFPLSNPINRADQGLGSCIRRVLETRDFSIGDYQIGRITGKAVVVFGYPILDDAGRIQSVVFAALDLDWLNRLAAGKQLPEGSVFLVLDHRGTILVRAFADAPDVARLMGERREVFRRRKDGGEFPAEASTSKLTHQGRTTFNIILRDITERNRAEEEFRLLRTLTLVISESEDLHSALDIALRKVCETTGWVLGQTWIPNPDGTLLESSPACRHGV